MEKKQVFISHRLRPDKEKADAVCRFLEENGYPCWIAPRDEVGGQDYPKQIVNAIDECAVLVLIGTANVNDSEHIESEISRAFDGRKTIIPFCFDSFAFSPSLDYFLRNKHRIDVYNGSDDAFAELLRSVRDGIAAGQHAAQHGDAPTPESVPAAASAPAADWGDAPPHTDIFGRQAELERLSAWRKEGGQIFCLVGAGGIGKSTLARNWADALVSESDAVVWISFKNRPELSAVFRKIHQLLQPSRTIPPRSAEAHIDDVVNALRQKRAVIVLDNLESIMQSGDGTGELIEDFLPLRRFLNRFADTASASAVLLTTREKPTCIEDLETAKPNVCHSVRLTGLSLPAVAALVKRHGLTYRTDESLQKFAAHHGGSPYAISICAFTIQNDFGGSIDEYIHSDHPLPSRLMNLLDTQVERLSELQRMLLFRLAVERVPVSAEHLQRALRHRYFDTDVQAAIDGLRQKSLLEAPNEKGLYFIQNVLSDYATDRICREMTRGVVQILRKMQAEETHPVLRDVPVITANASHEIRDAQMRTIAKPLYTTVSAMYSGSRLRKDLIQAVRALGNDPYTVGYCAGTLVNLLLLHTPDLNGTDFSGLCLWSCDFERADLIDTDLRNCDLQYSRFREVLAAVNAVAFADNVNRICFGTSDGMVHSRDVRSDADVAKKIHEGYVRGMAYSASDRALLTAGADKTLHILDPETLFDRSDPIAETDALRFVAVSSDGRRKVWGGEHGLLVQADANGILRQTDPSRELIRGGCIAGDQLCYVTESGTVRCGKFGEPISRMRSAILPGEPLWCVASADGEWLVSGKQGKVHRFDSELREIGPDFEPAGSPVWHIGVAASSVVLATSSGALLFCGRQDGRILYRVPAHENWIRALAVDADGGRIASGSADQSVRIYREKTRELLFDMEGASLNLLAVADTGTTTAAGGTDGMLHCWDNEKGTARRICRPYDCWIRSMAYSPALRQIAIGYANGTVELWDPASDRFLPLGVQPGGDVWCLDFHPQQAKLVSAGEDGSVCEWKRDALGNWNRKEIHRFGRWAISCRYSADGETVACGDGLGNIVLIRADGKTALPCQAGADQAWGLAWTRGGLVVAERSTAVRIWDGVPSPSPTAISLSSGCANWCAACAPQNDAVWIAGDGGCLCRVQGGRITRNKIAEGRLQAICASPADGTLVTVGYNGTVLRLSPEGEPVRQYFPDRQYSRLNVSGATGLTEPQRSSIIQFGGIG